MDKKEKEQKKKSITDFYKNAYCVDGDVNFLTNSKDFRISSVIELNDSERGKFYIGLLFVKSEVSD